MVMILYGGDRDLCHRSKNISCPTSNFADKLERKITREGSNDLGIKRRY
jgi:hypothetical protein